MEHTSAVTPSRSSPRESEGRKATLFCPDCGHASPLDGDWDERTVAGHRCVRCPDCRSVVDERRAPEPQPTSAASSLDRCVDTWTDYWSTWTTLLGGRPSADSDC
ncbi:hypothetical protein [Haloplanus pelagicus]|jgi:hypothetical protein|uniref:hypothetical protein n=1 Tax=Haloplanus pelagicus TaxID=2949995 RepID=UPI00203FF3D0|nr:hypothetical protein [Haloplanus sp. HW8-1]